MRLMMPVLGSTSFPMGSASGPYDLLARFRPATLRRSFLRSPPAAPAIRAVRTRPPQLSVVFAATMLVGCGGSAPALAAPSAAPRMNDMSGAARAPPPPPPPPQAQPPA